MEIRGEPSESVLQRHWAAAPLQRFTVNNLFKAAEEIGDFEFLKEALNSRPTNFLLSWKQDDDNSNIIHIAVKMFSGDADLLKHTEFNLLDFIEVALKELGDHDVISPLCAKDDIIYEWTPLHWATFSGWLPAIRRLVDSYNRRQRKSKANADSGCPPWLLKDRFGDTPLHTMLKRRTPTTVQASVQYVFSLDMESLWQSFNKLGHSTLSLAIEQGLSGVAEQVLESTCQYSLTGPGGFTLLHLAAASSEKVCRLLLEKHPELLEDRNNSGRYSVLHKWAEVGELGPLEFLLNDKKSAVMDMIRSLDNQDRTPLHVALMHHNISFAERLCIMESPNLWAMEDVDGNTPFHLALTNELDDEQMLLTIISQDPSILHIRNGAGETPLFIAVNNGHNKVVKTILQLPDPELIAMPLRTDGRTVLHGLTNSRGRLKEEVGQLLVEKFWWLIDSVDSNGMTPLQAAEHNDPQWAKRLLLRGKNFPFGPEFDWITASKRGHTSALIAFISCCPDFLRTCSERKDTPLHHIKLKSSKEYMDFLANPLIEQMKNMQDHNEATPLHRALERKDMLLVEALLTTKGVDRSMRDMNHKTASDMLAEICREDKEWKDMCSRNRINPWLRPTYVNPSKTNMVEMRQTLSVVAALFATLTFAAGFTVPGGFSNDNGEATMAKRAAFLVFILSDTIAMSCSMLALFCLIWSMVVDNPDHSVILIDCSVVILMLAFYGTLVAFMTGVFAVICHQSLWAAITVCVICSLVGISSNKTLLFKVVDMLIPDVNYEPGYQFRLLEQGKALFRCAGTFRKPIEKGTNFC